MGNCKDCKWWDKDEGHKYYPGYGKCKKVLDWDHEDREADDMAIIGNTDNFWGTLNTKPDFGCILFEQRENNSIQ